MSSDSQFTAIGGAAVGFQTNSATIDRGADIAGNSMGIHGSCESGVGVFGESTSSIGVHGNSAKGAGVFGESTHDRGGVFRSIHEAQLQLQPRPASIFQGSTSAVEDPQLIPQLPKDGKAGDLLAADFGFGEHGNCQLWFCVKGSEFGTPAEWRQVTLGSVVVLGVTT